jgi:hypothetical protein
MLTSGSLAFAGFITIGLFFWRLCRLIDRKVIRPTDIDQLLKNERRVVWNTLSLCMQHLVLLVPLAYLVGGIRYKNWAHMDGGAVIIGIVALGFFALNAANSQERPNQRSGRGVFTYNRKMVDILAWVGCLFLVGGAVSQIYWLVIPAILSAAVIFTHVGKNSRKAKREFWEDKHAEESARLEELTSALKRSTGPKSES